MLGLASAKTIGSIRSWPHRVASQDGLVGPAEWWVVSDSTQAGLARLARLACLAGLACLAWLAGPPGRGGASQAKQKRVASLASGGAFHRKIEIIAAGHAVRDAQVRLSAPAATL